MSLILMTSLVDYALTPQQKTWLYSLLEISLYWVIKRREHAIPSPPGSLNCAINTTKKIVFKKRGRNF